MNIQELKKNSSEQLITQAEELGVENASTLRKQEILFAILKKLAEKGEEITGVGVLQLLQDGFGFLRAMESNYLPGPDDIYVSPSQIRRFGLRTGDTVEGPVRAPKDGERYFALLQVSKINFEEPEKSRHKIAFDNLTPLYPNKQLVMEVESNKTEKKPDLTPRLIDLVSPIGKGQRSLIISPPKAGKTMILQSIANSIAKNLRKGHLISLESTTYPGTTEEVMLPILEKSGLKVNEDFYLAYSPERVDPGNMRYTTKNTNKVVGGVGERSLKIAQAFYSETIDHVVPVSSAKIAEMVKVYENTYRAVNIALVNEMMLLCDRMEINVWEMLEAAFTKPFGISPFFPGPGVGGHCIPLDPHYLEWKAREYDFKTRFIELAGDINRSMPQFVYQKIIRILNNNNGVIIFLSCLKLANSVRVSANTGVRN